MHIQESGEMYLETIFVLLKEKNLVRSVDVAEHMGYSKPSVSVAVKKLVNEGFITVEAGGSIPLTELGARRAADIYDRHRVITELLVRIGANRAVAEETACRMEHGVSRELMDVVREFLEQIF